MCSRFEAMVAFRYLRARREEGLISIIALFSLIGIALGVATLIVVLAVMNGVRGEMIKSVIGLDGHITVYGSGGITDYVAKADTIAHVQGVVGASAKVEGQIMASAHGQALGAMAIAYPFADLQKKNLLVTRLVSGTLAPLQQNEGVLIGSRMAEKMGLHVGDDITLISPEGHATVAGTVPRIKAYRIAGIFKIGMFAYDNGLIVMPFEEAQTYFKLKSLAISERVMVATPQGTTDAPMVRAAPGASAIEVMVADPDSAPAIARKIADIFPGMRVYDWKGSNNQIFQAVIIQRNVMLLILTLIVVVAAFNIVSSLIMLVREKGRAIAILRTMGATSGSITRIFLLTGFAVGVVGTALGVALGLLIAFNTENIQLWLEAQMGHKLFADELYFLSHLPSKVDFGETTFVACMALVISFLATLYPARKAASLDPAEALRYE